jgi:hypothetical protein
MKIERSNVEFPLWRKKVDKSLFEHRGTTIPNWACKMWGLPKYFEHCSSKLEGDSKVTIKYQKKDYQGWVTVARQGRKTPAYRLWFDDELCIMMSYMRSLEQSLSRDEVENIETKIPFWEFLDIEFDTENRVFRFVVYYRQEPTFPSLFQRLIGSPPLRKIGDELEGKERKSVYKQDWKPRGELDYEIGAYNVIYMLADTKNRLLYVGEASDLVKRLSQPHSTIPDWSYFRYNVIPDELSSYRIELERMMIRDLATLFVNCRGIESLDISDFKLTNDKIEK